MRFEWGATCATSRYFWTTQLHSFENQWKSLIGWVVLKCFWEFKEKRASIVRKIRIPKNPEILKKFHFSLVQKIKGASGTLLSQNLEIRKINEILKKSSIFNCYKKIKGASEILKSRNPKGRNPEKRINFSLLQWKTMLYSIGLRPYSLRYR